MNIVNEPISEAANKYLDYLSARQKTIASNLANVDTPGFRVKDVTFRKEVLSAIEGNNLPGGRETIEAPVDVAASEVENLAQKHDGNNVNLDREMSLMADTTLKYEMMVQMITGRTRILRTAIRQGR